MSHRFPAGFIRPGYDPLKVPNAPTIGTATGGDASASVSFTAPANPGGSAITAYYAVSNPDQVTATSATSPVSVTGLTNGTSYTFTVWALNTYGPSPYSAATGSITPKSTIALFGGGGEAATYTTIQKISFSSLGNAVDWGDLTTTRTLSAPASSSTRAVFSEGMNSSTVQASIDYIEFSSGGVCSNFGSVPATSSTRSYPSGCSNNTRGIIFGGDVTFNNIYYITIASTGNATSFGTLNSAGGAYTAACASTTRGVTGIGYTTAGFTKVNTLEYVTIATTGNATDFGDMTIARVSLGACSSSTRGLFAGGSGASSTNIIDYITISSVGNATDFGDLVVANDKQTGASSSTIGVFAGGSYSNVLQYVTIASTGNATDFGDLIAVTTWSAGASNCHGGIA